MLEHCATGTLMTVNYTFAVHRYLRGGIGFDAIWLHQPVFDLLDSAGKACMRGLTAPRSLVLNESRDGK